MSDSKFVAVGSIQDGKLVIIANADRFNGGREAVVMLPEFSTMYLNGEKFDETIEEILGHRTAEVGLNPDNLSPAAAAAYAETLATRRDDIHGFAEMLDALRTGEVESLAPMSEATLDEIDSEKIGEEFSTSGGHF